MLTSINLVGDNDDLDLLRDIEQVFDIRIPPAVSRNWWTIGHAHAWLLESLPKGSKDGRCPTAMAFYRLRSAIEQIATGKPLRPATPLQDLASNPAAFLRTVRRATGLAIPAARSRWAGVLGGWFISLGMAGCLAALLSGRFELAAIAAAGTAIGGLLCWMDRGRYPGEVTTLGDLARRVAALNRNKLRLSGARHMANEEWATLAAVVAEFSFVDADQIGPDTYFFAEAAKSDPRKARA